MKKMLYLKSKYKINSSKYLIILLLNQW